MQHCIMKDPPDGTKCGGFEDSSNVIAGDINWERGNRDWVRPSDSDWELRIHRDFGTDGNRITTVNYRLGTEDEAAFAALIAMMSAGDVGNDTELVDNRYRGIMTMGGDDPDDAAARFTLIDLFTATTDDSGIFGVLGDDEEGSIFGIASDGHIYEGNRARSLVPCC